MGCGWDWVLARRRRRRDEPAESVENAAHEFVDRKLRRSRLAATRDLQKRQENERPHSHQTARHPRPQPHRRVPTQLPDHRVPGHRHSRFTRSRVDKACHTSGSRTGRDFHGPDLQSIADKKGSTTGPARDQYPSQRRRLFCHANARRRQVPQCGDHDLSVGVPRRIDHENETCHSK